MKVLITGGTGLIGKTISEHLLSKGHEVVCLSRTENLEGKIQYYKWDIQKGEIDTRAFDQVDGIIHLSGAGYCR